MRVLVFCPTKRLEPETVKAIFALTGEPVDFLFTRDNPHQGEPGADMRHGQAGRFEQRLPGRPGRRRGAVGFESQANRLGANREHHDFHG